MTFLYTQEPILVNMTNNRIVFCFSTFQLQGDSDCQNDYLEIREGNATGPLVDRFCGNSLPSNYTSVIAHIMWVKFVSDTSVSGAGFRATFSHCECLCMRELTSHLLYHHFSQVLRFFS